jgi:hypothetical protein
VEDDFVEDLEGVAKEDEMMSNEDWVKCPLILAYCRSKRDTDAGTRKGNDCVWFMKSESDDECPISFPVCRSFCSSGPLAMFG